MQPITVESLNLTVIISLTLLQVSNILFVDQPVGTGFSYTSDKRDIRHDEKGVSDDLYDFLQVGSVTLSPFCTTLEGTFGSFLC